MDIVAIATVIKLRFSAVCHMTSVDNDKILYVKN